jgi:hypothetical protein
MNALPNVGSLQDMSLAELQSLWRSHLGGATLTHLPRFLLPKLLAYRLQVQQHGGLSKSSSRLLNQVADDLVAGRQPAMPYLNEAQAATRLLPPRRKVF